MDATAFREFIADNIKHSPIEAKIIRRIYKAMKAAGDPIVSVWDGEESTKVSTIQSVLDVVFNLDQSHLYTKSGGWVFIVMGNEWDAIGDYTIRLEAALAPVNEWIESKW